METTHDSVKVKLGIKVINKLDLNPSGNKNGRPPSFPEKSIFLNVVLDRSDMISVLKKALKYCIKVSYLKLIGSEIMKLLRYILYITFYIDPLHTV